MGPADCLKLLRNLCRNRLNVTRLAKQHAATVAVLRVRPTNKRRPEDREGEVVCQSQNDNLFMLITINIIIIIITSIIIINIIVTTTTTTTIIISIIIINIILLLSLLFTGGLLLARDQSEGVTESQALLLGGFPDWVVACHVHSSMCVYIYIYTHMRMYI